MEDRREIETSSTWPPTTAMVGRDSQRVGKSLSPPWSPRAVHARWIRFINPIRPSMDATGLVRSEEFWRNLKGSEKCWRNLGEKNTVPDEKISGGFKGTRTGPKYHSPVFKMIRTLP